MLLFFVPLGLVLLALIYIKWTLSSPLRRLPGPPSPSFFYGNLEQLYDMENSGIIDKWQAQYGSFFVYRGFLGACRLMIADPVAVAHVLGHAYKYPKPDFVRDSLASMAAGTDGILTVEGNVHKRQRKILTPAFSSAHIKSLTPIFWSKAIQLRDIWLSQVPDTSSSPYVRTDVLSWLARATLDVIGLAGFGYTFNSLSPTLSPSGAGTPQVQDELAEAFSIIFSTARKFRVMTIIQVWFPFLRIFRPNSKTMARAKETMERIGMRLIEERRTAFEHECSELKPESIFVDSSAHLGDQHIEGNKTTLGRDLLSVLVRSTLSANPSTRLTLSETLCQISTFIAAGHETTASALVWCLYALAKDERVQRTLREAMRDVEEGEREGKGSREAEGDGLGCSSSNSPRSGSRSRSPSRTAATSHHPPSPHQPSSPHPHSHPPSPFSPTSNTGSTTTTTTTMTPTPSLINRILRCEYLDWVVRETLRLHAPVAQTMRVCAVDWDVLPTSGDGSDTQRGHRLENDQGGMEGKKRTEMNRGAGIPLRRGDVVSIPIQAINKSRAIWGEDAGVFRPERWSAPPTACKSIPGLYSHTLTFLNGNPLDGNRACIGYKFALAEIKIFLYVLLKDLEFSIDPSMVIEKKVNVVTRPFVKSEPHLGNQMPLLIRRAS